MNYMEWCVSENREPRAEEANVWEAACDNCRLQVWEELGVYCSSSLKVKMATDMALHACVTVGRTG